MIDIKFKFRILYLIFDMQQNRNFIKRNNVLQERAWHEFYYIIMACLVMMIVLKHMLSVTSETFLSYSLKIALFLEKHFIE
jgi:hypothetical protein